MLIQTADVTRVRYLGPASVAEVEGPRVRVRLPDRDAWAQLALSVPYEPVAGDAVLVIEGEDVWVIGVLMGRGRTVFRSEGTLELHAKRVDIRGYESVQVAGPRVALKADRIEMTARSMYETFVDAYRWVKDLFHTKAGRSRTQVEGAYTVRADRILEHAKENVKLNGKKIQLG